MIAAILWLAVADGPIEVRARWLDPPPHFVNQAIAIEVTARNAGDGASITTPRVIGADLTSGDVDVDGPRTADQSGSIVATYRVRTSRPGLVRVPPFTVREPGTDRVGRSGSLSTQVRDLPVIGRTRSFLGGVGLLEAVEAEAVPDQIRVGDSFEYHLRIRGKAAVGSTQLPDFSGWDRLPLGLRVEPAGSLMVNDSERVVTARVRATVAGEADLPTITVSAFDPGAQVYRTWRSPRVPIRVAAAPVFSPSSVVYGPPPTPPPRQSIPWRAIGSGLAIGLAAIALGRWGIGAGRDPRRLAIRARRSLQGIDDPAILASRIESGLSAYLERASGRPPGALTPLEAREWVGGRLPDWADAAQDLIERADRARYSGRRESSDRLRADAVALFGALSARSPARTRKNHGDRRQV